MDISVVIMCVSGAPMRAAPSRADTRKKRVVGNDRTHGITRIQTSILKHTHTLYIHVYIYVCVSVCACVYI